MVQPDPLPTTERSSHRALRVWKITRAAEELPRQVEFADEHPGDPLEGHCFKVWFRDHPSLVEAKCQLTKEVIDPDPRWPEDAACAYCLRFKVRRGTDILHLLHAFEAVLGQLSSCTIDDAEIMTSNNPYVRGEEYDAKWFQLEAYWVKA
jgi:hypothetical protein